MTGSHPDVADLSEKMPVLFVGHGSPMNAIEDNEFSRAWGEMGRALPAPRAILCVSAHWETPGPQVTAMARPRTIYDFYGFPQALYDVTYPAPGSPELARLVQASISDPRVQLDQSWGLDHGAWSVLCRMFPEAKIPVVQLSLDRSLSPQAHYDLGRQLRALRHRGVLIVGSGNIVHNLRRINWDGGAFDWALEFDDTMRRLILAGDHAAIINYPDLGQAARLAIPTNEHFLPLLYILAQQEQDEDVRFFAEQVTLGSLSMRSVQIG
jgi:4,5-DOPA dioxygenase extradiol